MKRLLSILATSVFSVATVSSTVSCMPQKPIEDKKSPLNIGLDIDKTKAIDTSVDPLTHKGFTNFFIIGDSLSDVDGLTSYVKDKFIVKTGLEKYVNFNLSIEGSYGYVDDQNVHHNAFSNGPTTAYNIANNFGFKDLKPSNKYSVLKDEKQGYGKNYSIGGATAAKIAPQAGGIILNDVSIEEQARTLVTQQKISSNDFVLFEIGGNDLFSMISSQKAGDNKKVIDYMNESITRLRNALFTLLNNGIKNLFFLGPPIMDNIPSYANKTDEEKKEIIDLGKEYELKMQQVVKEVNSYYSSNFKFSSLYEGENSLTVLQKGYGEHILSNGLIQNIDEYKNNQSFTKNLKIKLNDKEINTSQVKNLKFDENIYKKLTMKSDKVEANVVVELIGKESYSNLKERDQLMSKYFFTDIVHPTKVVHEYVAEILQEKILKEFG
ncbi:SGNH/GDSL hydrolase family protein [Spiroplasma floricola]|uniref:Lipolytic enzyme, GDSL family n=1 Tax=Spiroplasma floricola 23-6 TaxID=1336749 RepID=A0A2K8SDD0_9MOLU|nr:SGNH/GDSL hydrolase family protein [Spiroplasma floricola]AUB31477.1 hypothetical protein SFLOR_v1c04250 [Spiroplasma floricola 23-6]